MPTNSNNQYYAPEIALAGAQVAAAYTEASGNGTAFYFQGAPWLTSILTIHEYVKTALTGANNDVVWIANTAGAVTLGVRYLDPAANSQALAVSLNLYNVTAKGSNKDLVFTAVDSAVTDITVTYVVAGNDTLLTIDVSGSDITVNCATNGGGTQTSTADEIRDALNGDAAAAALILTARATGQNGTGVPDEQASLAISKTFLDVRLATNVSGTITSTAALIRAAAAASATVAAVFCSVLSGADTGAGVVIALGLTETIPPAGSSPTFDLKLQQTLDGTNYVDVGSFTQIATTGIERKFFEGIVAAMGRWVVTIGGSSTPAFAYKLAAKYRA